jgi:hypothetical protein
LESYSIEWIPIERVKTLNLMPAFAKEFDGLVEFAER